jgi:hypothetical protein
MLWNENHVNILLFELPMTDYGGDITRGNKRENYRRGFIMSNDPKFPLVGNDKPPLDHKESNQLMKEGVVVE